MNQFKTFLLMFGLILLLMFVGKLIGGNSGMTIALIFGLGMNFVMYWFSDKIVLAMYRAKEVTEQDAPDLHRMVRNLSTVAGIPKPRVYIIPSSAPNAFATGRNPENSVVGVTSGILSILSHSELEGVIGHELSHIKNRDILVATIAAGIASAIFFISSLARWAAIFGGRDRGGGSSSAIGFLVAAILAPIVAMIIQLAISRSREYLADEGGAKISGNPLKLANALKKLEGAKNVVTLEANPATAHLFIVNPLRGDVITSLFSTHPKTKIRIERLEKMAHGKV